jgi:hypothetical protein
VLERDHAIVRLAPCLEPRFARYVRTACAKPRTCCRSSDYERSLQVKGLQAEYNRVTSAQPARASTGAVDDGPAHAAGAGVDEAAALKRQLNKLITERTGLQVGNLMATISGFRHL